MSVIRPSLCSQSQDCENCRIELPLVVVLRALKQNRKKLNFCFWNCIFVFAVSQFGSSRVLCCRPENYWCPESQNFTQWKNQLNDFLMITRPISRQFLQCATFFWWCCQWWRNFEKFRFPPLKSGTLYCNIWSPLPRCSPSGITWKRFYYNSLFAYSTLVDLVVALVT